MILIVFALASILAAVGAVACLRDIGCLPPTLRHMRALRIGEAIVLIYVAALYGLAALMIGGALPPVYLLRSGMLNGIGAAMLALLFLAETTARRTRGC